MVLEVIFMFGPHQVFNHSMCGVQLGKQCAHLELLSELLFALFEDLLSLFALQKDLCIFKATGYGCRETAYDGISDQTARADSNLIQTFHSCSMFFFWRRFLYRKHLNFFLFSSLVLLIAFFVVIVAAKKEQRAGDALEEEFGCKPLTN